MNGSPWPPDSRYFGTTQTENDRSPDRPTTASPGGPTGAAEAGRDGSQRRAGETTFLPTVKLRWIAMVAVSNSTTVVPECWVT